jgi:hypothetical protein
MWWNEKLWLGWSKMRFLLKTPQKRVRLEIENDGRHLTYLLVSLHSLGYGVHVVESPMVFRELLSLKRSTTIPFICGGTERSCDFVLSDRQEAIEKAKVSNMRSVFLDCDFFNENRDEPRMPYFMHPSVYHAGYYKNQAPNPQQERLVRLGFFGTRDAEFYTRNFHFPMLNREQILDAFFEYFGNQINFAKTPVSAWEKMQIVVSVDSRGGDHSSKSFMPLGDYLNALRACDFFLSPPGWCLPFSHNLIEGMASGSIPVLNGGEFLHPPLQHGVNCLSFTTKDGILHAIKAAMGMSPQEIVGMRRQVIQYYEEHLKPGQWLTKSEQAGSNNILVNAEEKSMPRAYDG